MDKLIYDSGFGILPKRVMIDPNLSLQAKGIFAYLVTYAGNGNEAFPSLRTISYQLGISKDTAGKYIKELKENGYLEIEQKKENGRFSHNVYKLIPCPKFTVSESTSADVTIPGNLASNINNNNINNNNINNNNNKKEKETTLDKIIKEYTTNNELVNTLVDFMKMRKSIKKPLTDRALKGILSKLDTLSYNDKEKIEILEQSIINCWSGVFPLKAKNNNSVNSIITKDDNNNSDNIYGNVKKTQFHNINQSYKNYTPEELKQIIKESQKRKFNK